MLKKLGDFSVQRNFLDALLFYVVYGMAGIFICGVITSMLVEAKGNSIGMEAKTLAITIAPIIAGIYTLTIALGVIFAKHLKKDALAILCAVVGAFASSSFGMIFGFIPVAVLIAFSKVK